jgi:hypothetical protein
MVYYDKIPIQGTLIAIDKNKVNKLQHIIVMHMSSLIYPDNHLGRHTN